jgi:hypothetical protein
MAIAHDSARRPGLADEAGQADYRVLLVFLLIAAAARLVFWIYTGRIWEDAMITLTPARNAWEGFGLTHHASEPYVHSFTSPISVLIPLLGESIGQGLIALRLASLAGGLAAIYYAWRIGQVLQLPLPAQIVLLGYLSLDHLQIFFGMGGMETQVVTAILLANVCYYLTGEWKKLGVAVGLAMISRPEFIFWIAALGLALLIAHRERIVTVVWRAAVVGLPWFAFATWYYGSPIPNTIVAKSWSYRVRFLSAGWDHIGTYLLGSWRHIAPFRQYWAVVDAPLPDALLLAVVLGVIALALIGLAASVWTRPKLITIAGLVVLFVAYKTGSVIDRYYMWYLPPFMAVLFVFVALGIARIGRLTEIGAVAIVAIVVAAYATPFLWSLELDRRTQVEIEQGVRTVVGRKLNQLMGRDDTVVLEPLGFVGWEARNKTIYDFPGLGSRIAVSALRDVSHASLETLAAALRPTFLMLRPAELAALRSAYSDVAAAYEPVDGARLAGPANLRFLGLSHLTVDDDFTILRRLP